MKPVSCKQEMGDTERLLCPGAPQGPAGFQVLHPGAAVVCVEQPHTAC